ncbi:hypothetical protein [Lewinella sp. IMCC34183]|uniref:hypothetical protein n=1 Tax=Lewinella sp. IMCC34183 TaxID=2248762 RepID=UPI000E2592CC|nr:hypothetical protein [Lewinella sp. IMCC34183]
MKRENPLPLFFILFFLVMLSTTSRAQVEATVADSLRSARTEQLQELRRIEALTSYGPHYKNPNAAGRLITLNRAVPPLPADYAPARVMGPTYKNRKPALTPADTTAVRRRSTPRLMGPRYKNRGAKTGNL